MLALIYFNSPSCHNIHPSNEVLNWKAATTTVCFEWRYSAVILVLESRMSPSRLDYEMFRNRFQKYKGTFLGFQSDSFIAQYMHKSNEIAGCWRGVEWTRLLLFFLKFKTLIRCSGSIGQMYNVQSLFYW